MDAPSGRAPTRFDPDPRSYRRRHPFEGSKPIKRCLQAFGSNRSRLFSMVVRFVISILALVTGIRVRLSHLAALGGVEFK
jgi:hypothetical protein